MHVVSTHFGTSIAPIHPSRSVFCENVLYSCLNIFTNYSATRMIWLPSLSNIPPHIPILCMFYFYSKIHRGTNSMSIEIFTEVLCVHLVFCPYKYYVSGGGGIC